MLMTARAAIQDSLMASYETGGLEGVQDLLRQQLSPQYINGLISDLTGNIRSNFAASNAGISTVPTSSVFNDTSRSDTFNLQAVTNADPQQIMNEYVWAQRVRLRGGSS
jgi:hypothetical protein